jgi:VanZ family protein
VNSKILIAASLVLIADATLQPFTFSFHALTWTEWRNSFGLAPATLLDAPRNVLLFVPLGIGLASSVGRGKALGWGAWVGAFLGGLVVAVSVESLQIFVPGRTANVSDAVSNSLGTVVGFAGFRAWRRRQALERLPTTRGGLAFVGLCGAVWLGLAVLLSWLLMGGMRPGGWDSSSHLALGRGVHGARWNGEITELVILDRVPDVSETKQLLSNRIPRALDAAVVAEYHDVGRVASSPVVSKPDESGWRPDVSALAEQDGTQPGRPPPGQALGHRINATGQYTVAVTLATFDLTQSNSEVVGVIGTSGRSVLTIRQDQTRLTLAWRSPFTSVNNGSPEINFPAVFTSSSPRRVVIGFDGTTAFLYSGDQSADNVVFLSPETLFSAAIRETGCWPLAPSRLAWWESALPLPALIFLPLGFGLALSHHLVRGKAQRAAVRVCGMVAPAVLIEACTDAYGGTPARLDMIVVDIALIALAFTFASARWRFIARLVS